MLLALPALLLSTNVVAAPLCSIAGWTAGFGSYEVGAPNSSPAIPRSSEPCALRVDQVGEYVRDDSPSADPTVYVTTEFYLPSAGAGTSTVLRLYDSSSATVAQASISGTTFGGSAGPVSLATTVLQLNSWYRLTYWTSTVTGQVGYQLYQITPTGAGTVQWTSVGSDTKSATVSTIERVEMGILSGSNATVVFDNFEATRDGAPALPCLCDANADNAVNSGDGVIIRNEYLQLTIAMGRPDCNGDGAVNSGDGILARNMFLAGYVCPAPIARNLIFKNTFAPSCALDTDSDRLANCAEYDTHVFVSTSNTGTNPSLADTDFDGLGDGDEVLGTIVGLDLPTLGAKPLKKDILIEYDWTNDAVEIAQHSHRPSAASIEKVRAMFAASPNVNPDWSTGINVIQDYGQGAPFTGGNLIPDTDGNIDALGSEFYSYKSSYFDPNRLGYFHYAISTHRYNGSNSSGYAEIYGDDLIISLYTFFANDQYFANTAVHELGHNLGLLHGGNEYCNDKPNYSSVMNYRYTFAGVDINCNGNGGGGTLNLSPGTRSPLNENALNEFVGVCGSPAIDWNGNGVLQSSVAHDINPGNSQDCGGVLTTLTDFNDWTGMMLDSVVPNGFTRMPQAFEVCPSPP
jgi:hypothetical protein